MAQRRMIHEKMLGNVGFGLLSPNAKVLYIFTIVLADDDGRLKANATALRGRIFPFETNVTDVEVRKYLNEIVKTGLVIWYKIENEYYIQHPNWTKYQILRSDRKKDSDIPPPDDNQVATKRGRSKISKISKISKEEKETSNVRYLQNIPENDLDEFHKRFDASKKAIISKGEDLFLWCASNGKVKKNYKATLLNALKKDFPERKQELPSPIKKKEEEFVEKPIPKDIKDSISKLFNRPINSK